MNKFSFLDALSPLGTATRAGTLARDALLNREKVFFNVFLKCSQGNLLNTVSNTVSKWQFRFQGNKLDSE